MRPRTAPPLLPRVAPPSSARRPGGAGHLPRQPREADAQHLQAVQAVLANQMLTEAFAEVARGGTAGLAEVPAAQLEELRDDPVEKDWGPDLPAAPRGTLLLCAARHENVQAVELLLGRNVNVDATNEDSQSALYWAARVGSVAVVTRLLDKGASLELASKTGNTPLMQAAIFGKEAVAKLLLEMGASADTANKDGWTALMAAAQKGHEAVVKLLLDKGAAVDAVL